MQRKTWNILPEEVVTTNSLNSFKRISNKVWRNNQLKFNAQCYKS